MGKILLCGGSGHVGAALAPILQAQGHQVITLAFDNSPAIGVLKSLGIVHHHIDLTRYHGFEQAFEGVDIVINLAAKVSFRDRDRAAVEPVNVTAVKHILMACRQFNVKRLVHFSSIDVFSGQPRSAMIHENSPLITPEFPLAYPRSKRLGQQLVMDAVAAGLDAIIIYPTSIIGPSDYFLRSSNRILYMLATGRMPVLLNAGLTVVDVRDVAEFTAKAALKAPAGASYVLTGPWAHFRDFADCLQPYTGHKALPFQIPLPILQAIAPLTSRISDTLGGNSPLTRTAFHGVSHYKYVSSEKAQNDFGFSPRPLSETVRDAWQWMSDGGMLEPSWKLDSHV
ncbi:MAG: hypothetical protein RIR11_3336 [Bacteroidota bacterium]